MENTLEKLAVLVAGLAALGSAGAAGVGAWQASIMSDTAKRQLRAYVGAAPGEVENFGNKDTQTFNFVIKNYGATAAYDVFVASRAPAIIKFGENIAVSAN